MEERVENEQMEQEQPVQQSKPYEPRPTWQVWGARIGVVIMIISVALYIWHIASGGMR